MAQAEPDSGTLTLRYLRPSDDNGRNDYRLSGTVRWNKAEDLACFSAGRVDWSYENNLTYQQHFHRNIWSRDFSAFPSKSRPYIDAAANARPSNTTDLTFGIFRPDKLKAGRDYKFAYSIFLPSKPRDNRHSLYLVGQIIERDTCVFHPGTWCVGVVHRRSYAPKEGFIGVGRKFSVTGTTCWAWRNGRQPVPCPASHPPAAAPAPGGGNPPQPPQPRPAQTVDVQGVSWPGPGFL